MKIVAVTACRIGTAHTYMAADKLLEVAPQCGVRIKVETQGAMGIESPLTESDIIGADLVILAADIEVHGADRFAESLVLRVSTREAIAETRGVFTKARGMIGRR